MEYNGFGQKVSEIKTNNKGKVQEKSLFEYDKTDDRPPEKTYNSKEELIFSKTLEYEY